MPTSQQLADQSITVLTVDDAEVMGRPFGFAYAAIRTGSAPIADVLAQVATAGRSTADALAAHLSASGELPSQCTRGRRVVVTAALATVWATQQEYQHLALAAYLAIVEQAGADVLSGPIQTVMAQVAFLLGRDDQVRHLPLAKISDLERHYLEVDRANPWLSRLTESWGVNPELPAPTELERHCWERLLGREFVANGLTGPVVEPGADTIYDGLTCETPSSVDGPLVTVIMPCFRPDSGLLTSVRSILSQSYENLQILLADDASGPGSEHWFERCRSLDPRIEVVTARRNGGTYSVRNLALASARGEFITFQDADDWSHPARLAAQVSALAKDRRAAGSISDAIRAKDDLTHQWLGYSARRRNASSLMVRRAVVDAVGGFDPVRKSADSEYFERIQHMWGPVLDVAAPLAITRLRAGTLSRSDFRFQWTAPDRLIYRDQYRLWHERAENLMICDGVRPFPVPPRFVQASSVRQAVELDAVLVADVSQPAGVAAVGDLLDQMESRIAVGVLHREDPRAGRSKRPAVQRDFLEWVADGRCVQVSASDAVHADVVIVPDPNLLCARHRPTAAIRARSVLLVSKVPTSVDDIIDHVTAADEAHLQFGARARWVAATEHDYRELTADGFVGLRVLADEMVTIVEAHPPDGSV